MYVPSHFAFTDRAEIVAFMRRYNFATVVSQLNGEPYASHLPFVVEETADEIRLLAHFAKANPQWQHWADQTVMVIFSEPHAYVSPSLYEKEQNVPTWNYVAVHAYGVPELISDETRAFGLLEKQMAAYEPAYLDQWNRLLQDYKNAMIKGIVAFEMTIQRLDAKNKLSQNKSAQERHNVREHLLDSDDSTARAIGEMMQAKM